MIWYDMIWYDMIWYDKGHDHKTMLTETKKYQMRSDRKNNKLAARFDILKRVTYSTFYPLGGSSQLSAIKLWSDTIGLHRVGTLRARCTTALWYERLWRKMRMTWKLPYKSLQCNSTSQQVRKNVPFWLRQNLGCFPHCLLSLQRWTRSVWNKLDEGATLRPEQEWEQ